MFTEGALKAVLHNLMPSIVASIDPKSNDLNYFHEFDNLFKEGIKTKKGIEDVLLKRIPLMNKIQDSSQALLRYDTPDIISSKLLNTIILFFPSCVCHYKLTVKS